MGLEAPGKDLDYKQVPEPVVRAGTVRVRVDAAPLLSYLRAYTAGELTALRPPDGEFTPGTNGVGVIDEIGEDVWHLQAGQRIVLSPYLVADENVDEPAEVLAGLTAMSEGSGDAAGVARWHSRGEGPGARVGGDSGARHAA